MQAFSLQTDGNFVVVLDRGGRMISAPTVYYGVRVRALDEKRTSVGTNIVRPLEFYASLFPKTENFANYKAGG